MSTVDFNCFLCEVKCKVPNNLLLHILKDSQILKSMLMAAPTLCPLAHFLDIQKVQDVFWLIPSFQPMNRLCRDASKYLT